MKAWAPAVKRLCYGMLAATMMTQAVEASSLVPPFDATYTLRMGVVRGETRMRMSEDGGVFLLESEIEPKGLVKIFARGKVTETSHFVYDDNGVRPIDYARLDTIKDKNTNMRFDWDAGIVTSTYRDETREEALAPGILDRQLVLFAFMHDLVNDIDRMNYTVVDRKGRLKIFEVTKLGEEEIDTPAGRFQTIKFEHRTADSTRITTFWCAPDLHFLPARIEQRRGDKKPSRAELQSIEGL